MNDPTNVYRFRPPQVTPRRVVIIAAALIALTILVSAWFTVEPEEAGLVLRFGRFARVVPPGLHLKAPYPIERVIKVPVERQLKEEF